MQEIGRKALREPVFSRFLYDLLQSESLLREDALAVLAGQAMEGYGPDRALMQLCVEVIRKGDLEPTKAYYLSGRGGVGGRGLVSGCFTSWKQEKTREEICRRSSMVPRPFPSHKNG